MSNLSDDTLRKILGQIQNQAVSSQKALQIVRAQIQAKEKDRKILQLTIRELGAVPVDNTAFKGVGKMFVRQDRGEVDREHKEREGGLELEIANLVKKARYLEKQFEEANAQLKDIFHSQQRERQQQ